jgi:hypothetical protein
MRLCGLSRRMLPETQEDNEAAFLVRRYPDHRYANVRSWPKADVRKLKSEAEKRPLGWQRLSMTGARDRMNLGIGKRFCL